MTMQITNSFARSMDTRNLSPNSRPNYRVAALRLCKSLQAQSLDSMVLLGKLGIAPDLADDALAIVSGQQMVMLLNAVKGALSDEFYGFSERRIKPGTFALLMETGLHCDTLEALIEHAVRFMDIVSDDLAITLNRHDDEVALCLRLRRPELDSDHFLMDHLLLLLHRVLSWSVGYLIPVTRLTLSIPEAATPERLCYWLCGNWEAAQTQNAMYFSKRCLTLPLVRTPLEWRAQIAQGATGQPQWPKGEQRWSLRLRAVLRADLLAGRKPSALDRAAETLGQRSHSLRRQLHEEGSNYQQVLDGLRRDMAIEKLHLHHQSVADVAEQLGFAEARSFSRAFKQWTGYSPRHYMAYAAGVHFPVSSMLQNA